MQLILTNMGREPEALAALDASQAQLLQPGTRTRIHSDAHVLIVGDKPELREQLRAAFAALAGSAGVIFDTLASRKDQVRQQSGRHEVVDVRIENHGTDAVHAVLAGGARERGVLIQPGQHAAVGTQGYIELREPAPPAQQPGK